ncbi:MAG: Alpha-galactosidase [Lentisphaerae bacterium ADurb.Bin242]|nr:MAG: Alpha-galactosidase [Lentisphaerae bacterium ADurb.Bin242]
MKKIVLIGAGGVIFTQGIIRDLLLDETTGKCQYSMMDIDAARLDRSCRVMKKLAKKLGVPFDPEETTELRTALKGADYVITIFRCGTLEHQKLEYEIPAKYGVKQVVGDTLNPGGVFRGLRTLKALLEVLDAMEEVCPGAMLLNYVNPMSMNTIALSGRAKTVRVFGLCHSVQGTSRRIAEWLKIPYEKLHYCAAGVNHQAFMLKLEADGRDLYPELRKCLDDPEIYHQEKVRFEMLRHFGYFPTEGSGHGSEYVPYFRKRTDLLEKYCSVTVSAKGDDPVAWRPVAAGVPGASLETCRLLQIKNEKESQAYLEGRKDFDLTPGHEYAPQLIAAMEKNTPLEANLNVMNRGLIPTLPPGACVEVPCLVTGAGIFPARIENYPEHLAALNRAMINVQILGAQGALSGSRRDIFHAIAADPLTSAVLGLDEIQSMTDELFEALKDQIDPRFSQKE